jgi:hypothetical protein
MGSIRIRIDIAPDGTVTGKAPPAAAGAHEVVVPQQADPDARRRIELPLDDCGAWPEHLSLRREDLYRDDGR